MFFFEVLSISKSRLSKHVVEKIRLSLIDLHVYTMDKDVERTPDLRFNVIIPWKSAGVDLQTDCLCMDEASIRLELKNSLSREHLLSFLF